VTGGLGLPHQVSYGKYGVPALCCLGGKLSHLQKADSGSEFKFIELTCSFWGSPRINSRASSFSLLHCDLTHLPISHGSHSVLYADDLLLFRAIKKSGGFLQNDVSVIDDMVQQNYLTLNSGKCKRVVISRTTNPGTSVVLVAIRVLVYS